MATIHEFPQFTRYGPSAPDQRRRLAKMFAGKTRDEMRALWDSFDERTSFCGEFDCADVHSYMNMIGDGIYCAV